MPRAVRSPAAVMRSSFCGHPRQEPSSSSGRCRGVQPASVDQLRQIGRFSSRRVERAPVRIPCRIVISCRERRPTCDGSETVLGEAPVVSVLRRFQILRPAGEEAQPRRSGAAPETPARLPSGRRIGPSTCYRPRNARQLAGGPAVLRALHVRRPTPWPARPGPRGRSPGGSRAGSRLVLLHTAHAENAVGITSPTVSRAASLRTEMRVPGVLRGGRC